MHDHRPDAIAAAAVFALGADRPFVLDMVTDPNVPPLPPHITFKEARHFMGAIARDPEAGSVIVDTARELVSAILPSKGRKTE